MLVLFIVKPFTILGQFLFRQMCTATVFSGEKTKPVVWPHFSSLLMTTCSLLSKMCGTFPEVYIVKSSTYRVDFTFSDRVLTMSLIATKKQVQDSTLPWGVPSCTPTESDKTSPTHSHLYRSVCHEISDEYWQVPSVQSCTNSLISRISRPYHMP